MIKAGIIGKSTMWSKVTSQYRYSVAPNLVDRQFDVDCPDNIWAIER